jgi:hypothetical protein
MYGIDTFVTARAKWFLDTGTGGQVSCTVALLYLNFRGTYQGSI